MISPNILALIITLISIFFYKYAYKRPAKNFPPGPPRLPIWGAYWIILAKDYNNLGRAMKKFAKEYKTKLIGMYLGAHPAVVVDDPVMIKEMLNRKEFDGRMDFTIGRMRAFWKRLGLFFTDDYFWRVQRRFSLRFLRDFGFGRRDETLEGAIEHEIQEMLNVIHVPKFTVEKEIVKGDLIRLPHIFSVPFINGLLYVYCRKALQRSEYHEIWHMAKRAALFLKASNDFGGALSITPWLKDIFPKWSGYTAMQYGNEGVRDFMAKFVEEALATYDESHDRHFIDVYIRKMNEEIKQKKRTTFSTEQLVMTLVDYLSPTATAVETTLTFLVERMLLQPEVQERLHEEVDQVVGRLRLPNLDDRLNMPYTEACIREIMRYETLVPLGVAHRTFVDTELGGYNIPKDTLVAVNYVSLHHNKELWKDPENFRPERFIVNGKLEMSADKSLPFGAGRRLCPGETFARQTMFLVFAAFVQAFHISTPDGIPLRKPNKRVQGIIMMLPNFWIRVKPRT